MDPPRTPPPRIPYERYVEVMAEYEEEKRQAEEIQHLWENRREMAMVEMETAQVLLATKIDECRREHKERDLMLSNDGWEQKNPLDVHYFHWMYDRLNPVYSHSGPELQRFHEADDIFRETLSLTPYHASLKPPFPSDKLRGLNVNAPLLIRHGNFSPIDHADSSLGPRALFSDDDTVDIPAGKLQRVGDAALVPFSFEQVLVMTEQQRTSLRLAMVEREMAEEDDVTYSTWHTYYYDNVNVYENDDVATGDEAQFDVDDDEADEL